jgi:nucleotide-binding universal stress UspA family protein
VKVERILVAVDGSPGGMAATTAGAQLARAFGAEIVLLHVSNEPTVIGSMGTVEVPGELLAVYDEYSEKILEDGARIVESFGIPGETISVPGDAASMILEVAAARRVDVIVMGHRGLSRVERFLLGSVSNKVVQHAPCGVFLVPEHEEPDEEEHEEVGGNEGEAE